MPEGPVQNTGEEFADPDVARAYLRRPPYPVALIDRLLELAPRPGHALDLGCGPGKLALALADRFETLTAVDPSAAMIAQARRLDVGRRATIRWRCARAEATDFGAPVDLAVAGASLHWMDHRTLFPRLHDALAPAGVVAAIEGDGPSAAPWLADFRAFVADWVGRLGFVFDHPDFVARMTAHEAWIDIDGRETFAATHTTSIADLIEAQHSRATWARAKMGPLAEAFDTELGDLLAPHAVDGAVTFAVETKLTWGRPRRTPLG